MGSIDEMGDLKGELVPSFADPAIVFDFEMFKLSAGLDVLLVQLRGSYNLLL